MFICVETTTKATRDEDSDELVPTYRQEAHVEENVEQQLELMALGDDRVAHLRIFELEIADDGTPSIGSEVRP